MVEESDWTAFHEVEEALDRLAWLVLRRWNRRNVRLRSPAVAKDLADALNDLRPLIREASGTWRRLALYLPEHTKEEE